MMSVHYLANFGELYPAVNKDRTYDPSIYYFLIFLYKFTVEHTMIKPVVTASLVVLGNRSYDSVQYQ